MFIKLPFNSAIADVDLSTGAINKEFWKVLETGVRSAIRTGFDGITKVELGVFEITVWYEEKAVDQDAVREHVRAKIKGLAGKPVRLPFTFDVEGARERVAKLMHAAPGTESEDIDDKRVDIKLPETVYFPLLGDKQLKVGYDEINPDQQEDPPRYVQVRVDFPSDLVAFAPNGTAGWNKEAFQAAVAPLAEKLTHFDGVINFELSARFAWLKFTNTSVDDDDLDRAYHHIIDVLMAAVREAPPASGSWFPFEADRDNIAFSAKRIFRIK